MAAVASRQGEEAVTVSRITKTGRKLTYRLAVIQQPERARACGSGAKSSADRRPVDPPPVVELRIFEGEGQDKEDITFSYSANFFLFATLEMARPIAHGRVQQAPANPQVPVLTGMPVSGMAYLDRPNEAGYFIFPDLSVRHEGKYRLSFNLYEETKDENDADAEPANDTKKVPAGPNAPDASFDWRLEIKSATFIVYSAKKFPGLAESTVLSRTVAEQGCRVRIRRDVRMRRREGKMNGDFDEGHEDEYSRGGRPSDQEPYRERSRSHSTGSEEGRAPYSDSQRRMSGEFQGQQPYPQYTPSPVTPHAAAPQGGHLSFLNPSVPQYAAPPQPQFAQPAPPPPAPPSFPYNSTSFQPPSQQCRPPPPPPPAAAPAHPNYAYERQYPQSAYPSNPPREREVYEPDYRRASVAGYNPPAPPNSGPYPTMDSGYNRPPYHSYAPRPHSPSVNLAPLKMPAIEPKYESATSPPGPLSSVSRIAPPLPSPSFDRSQERSGSYSQYSAPPASAPAEPTRNGKRPFDAVFSTAASNQPLYNGMRPASSHKTEHLYDEDEPEDQMKMFYKRADGSHNIRDAPSMQ